MLKPKPALATYADIEALPPNLVGEIIFGVLHTHPRPTPRHGIAAGELQLELGTPFGRGRGGPGAAWRRERLTPFPETAFIETSPDWLAEMPSTQAVDRTDKLAVYAEFGVGHCWYVDPVARTLEVLALTAGKWLLAATFKNDDSVTAPPFEVHTFALDVLWVEDSQSPAS